MPTVAEVERIRAAMQALPEVKPEQREVGNQEAVTQLAADIESMRAKGYTWDEIAEFFGKNGITIKATTLKSYARRAGAGSQKGRKPRQKKRTPAAAPTAAPAPPVQKPETQANATKPATKQKNPTEADARFTAREDSNDI